MYGQPALYGGEAFSATELPEFDAITTNRVKLGVEFANGRISSGTPTQARQTKVPQPLRDNWWNYLFNPLPVDTREGYIPLGANFYVKNNGLLGAAWDFLSTPLRAGYGLIADTQRGYYWLRQQTANSPLARLYDENKRWMQFVPGLARLNELLGDAEGTNLAYQMFNQPNAFPEREEGFSGRFVSIFPNLTATVAGAQMAAFDTEQQTRQGSDIGFEIDPAEAEFSNPNAGLIFGWHNPFTGDKWFDYNRYAERGEEGYEWIQNLPRFLGGNKGFRVPLVGWELPTVERIGEQGLERPWLEVPYSLASVFAGTAGLVISDIANPVNLAFDIPFDRAFNYIGKSKFWKANVQPWMQADETWHQSVERAIQTGELNVTETPVAQVTTRDEQLQRIEDLYTQLDALGAGEIADAEIASTARALGGALRTYTPEQATDVVRMQLIQSGYPVDEADFAAAELSRALNKQPVQEARKTQLERVQALASDASDELKAEAIADSIYERELRRLVTGEEPDMSVGTVGDAAKLSESDYLVYNGDTGKFEIAPEQTLPQDILDRVANRPGIYWDNDAQGFRVDPLEVPVAKLNEFENTELLYDADTQALVSPLSTRTAYTEDEVLEVVDSFLSKLTPEELEANRAAAIALLPEDAQTAMADQAVIDSVMSQVDEALANPEWADNMKLIAEDVVTELNILWRREAMLARMPESIAQLKADREAEIAARRVDVRARLVARNAPPEPEVLTQIAQSRFPQPTPKVPPANVVENVVAGRPSVTTANSVGEAIPRPIATNVEYKVFELRQRGYTIPEIIRQTGLTQKQVRVILNKPAPTVPEVEASAIEVLPSQATEPTTAPSKPKPKYTPPSPVESTYQPTKLPEPVVNGVQYPELEDSINYWKLENVQSLVQSANYAGIKLNLAERAGELRVVNTHDELVSLLALHDAGYLPPVAYKNPGRVSGVEHPWYKAYRERIALQASSDPYAPGVGNVRRQRAEEFMTPKLKQVEPETTFTPASQALPEPTEAPKPTQTSQDLPATEPPKSTEPQFEVVEVESAPVVEGFMPKQLTDKPVGTTAFDNALTYEAPEPTPDLDEYEAMKSLVGLVTKHELEPDELPTPTERRRSTTTAEMHEAALADIASGKLAEYPKSEKALARWFKERESAEAILRVESTLDKLEEVSTKLDNGVYVSEYEQSVRSDARRVGAAEEGLDLETVKANVRAEAEYILSDLENYTSEELKGLLSKAQLGVPGYGKLRYKAQRYALAKATLEDIINNLEPEAVALPADNPTAYKLDRLNEALRTGQGVEKAAREVTDQLIYENSEELMNAVDDFRAVRDEAQLEAAQEFKKAKAKKAKADAKVDKVIDDFYSAEVSDIAAHNRALAQAEKAKRQATYGRIQAEKDKAQKAADDFVAQVLAKKAAAEAATEPAQVLEALDELETAETAAKAVIDTTTTVPISDDIADEPWLSSKWLSSKEFLVFKEVQLNKDILIDASFDFEDNLVDLDLLRESVVYDLDDTEFEQALKALAKDGKLELIASDDPTEFTPTDLANAITVCGIPIKSVRFL
jgi:hypothetical protein